MVRKLIDWAVDNPLIVLLLAAALAVGGGYAFTHVNIEAYPDPAPAIIEVVAQYPGASAEEVERQVTDPARSRPRRDAGPRNDPQQVAVRPVPHPQPVRLRPRLRPGQAGRAQPACDASTCRPGVTPQISPASPIGEILRLHAREPDRPGHRQAGLHPERPEGGPGLRRPARAAAGCPRIAGVTGVGGTVKRYEVQPDPERLRRYGVTLAQFRPPSATPTPTAAATT